MIRHVVLFTFKDEVPAGERAAVIGAIRGLLGAIPSLRSLEVGETLSPARAQGYALVALGAFDDRAGLEAYLAHPAHLPVAARFRAAAAQTLVVDVEI